MKTLFDDSDRRSIITRLHTLQPAAARVWGKMNPAQMLAHCAGALEIGTGDRPTKQRLIGKIIVPFIRASALGEKPFSRNSPTDPAIVIADARDFDKERTRLLALIDRFVERGPTAAGQEIHSFFGKLSGDEWGRLAYKHIDHHLTQFGV